MTGIPDARCPRCEEIRPRDGSIGHTTKRGEYCTVMDGQHVYFFSRKAEQKRLAPLRWVGPK